MSESAQPPDTPTSRSPSTSEALADLPTVLVEQMDEQGYCRLNGFLVRLVEELPQRNVSSRLPEELDPPPPPRVFRVGLKVESNTSAHMGGERMRLLTVSPEQDARGVRALKRALDWLEGKPGGQALPQTVDLWEVDGVLMLLTSDHLLGSQALTQDDWIRLDRNVSVAWLIQLALTLGGLHEAGLALGHLAAHDLAARSERDPVVVAQLGQMVELETLPQDLALEMIDRDIFAVGKLLLRAFTTVPVGRVLGLFEAFGYEPEAMMDLGLVRPGLMQALSGALASMTDLSYLSMDELLDGLLQLRAEMQRPLTFRTGIASSCGNYPLRRTDQDSAGMTETRYAYHGKQRHLGFYCVADGVGGEEAGELASQLAISSALSGFHRAIGAYTYGDLFTNTTAFARHLVKTAAQRLAIAGEEEPDVHKGATTFTGMLIAGERAGIGHIGDSRAYLLRNDRLIRLTRDHNLANIRVAVGELTPEEAEASGDDQRQLARYLDTGQEAPLEWIDGFDPALIPNLIQPEAPHAATPTFSGPSAAGLFSSQSDTEEPTSGLFGHPNPMAPGTPSALAVSAATPSRELNLPPARHNPPSLTVSTPLGELLAASLPSPPPDWSPAPPKAGPEEPTPPSPEPGVELRSKHFYNTPLEERARIGHLNLLRGDRILIVSDGVSGDLSPRQIRDILTFSDDPDTVARSLIEAAMQAFAADNVTALVVLVEQAEPNLR